MNRKTEKKINEFIKEIECSLLSLKEHVENAESTAEQWTAVDTFMKNMKNLQEKQPMTNRKSFTGLENGQDVEGDTGYLQHLLPMPIFVNTIRNDDGSLSPSKVCEMHIGEVDGKPCVLLTPAVIHL